MHAPPLASEREVRARHHAPLQIDELGAIQERPPGAAVARAVQTTVPVIARRTLDGAIQTSPPFVALARPITQTRAVRVVARQTLRERRRVARLADPAVSAHAPAVILRAVAVGARRALRETPRPGPLRTVLVLVARARAVASARAVRPDRVPRLAHHRLQLDVLRLVAQLQRVLHRHVSVAVAAPVAARAVPPRRALAAPVVVARPVVGVARVARHGAVPAGVRAGVAAHHAVDELVQNPNHVVIRVAFRFENARRRVENAALHRVDQPLALVHVVREPHVLRLRGLLQGQITHFTHPELAIALAHEVRLHDVVAQPRPHRVPIRAAPLGGAPEDSSPHALEARAFRDFVAVVHVVAHRVRCHGLRNTLDVRHEFVARGSHGGELAVHRLHL